MMRLVAILLAACVFAAAADAAVGGPRAVLGDGTLSVQGASGVIDVRGYGAVLGTASQARIQIVAPSGSARVSGATRQRADANGGFFVGNDVSFRILGSSSPGAPSYHLRITGSGIDLSITGRAVVTIVGAGTADDGQYSLNGGPSQAITDTLTTLLVTGISPGSGAAVIRPSRAVGPLQGLLGDPLASLGGNGRGNGGHRGDGQDAGQAGQAGGDQPSLGGSAQQPGSGR